MVTGKNTMPYKGILISQSTYMRAKQLENILKNDKSQNSDDSYDNYHFPVLP